MEDKNQELQKSSNIERKPITVGKLHNIMDDVIYGLLDGSMKPNIAKEVTNAAGKKAALTKLQLDYAGMWGGKVEIPFLGSDEDENL